MSNVQTSDLQPIQRLIARTRQLLRLSWVIIGMAVTCGLLLGTLLVAALADLTITLWPSLRWVALALVVIPVGGAFVMGVLRSALRRLGLRGIARRIEEHIPMIHNRLVSCVDLAADREQKPLSPAFRQRLIEEATERVRVFDPMRVVDMPRIRRALLAAGGVLVVFVLAWLALSDRLTTAIARVFCPWDDIPPASGVLYTVEPGNATVLRGDEIAFAVHVQKGDPESLQLEISAEDGSTPLRYDLRRRQDNLWTFSLRGFETSFNYRVIGGGTWTLPFHITMVDRPRLVSLQATLHYPKYFGPTEPRPNPPQVADVSGPEQSEVEIAVGVAGDVARGEIRLFQARRQQAAAAERPERSGSRSECLPAPRPRGPGGGTKRRTTVPRIPIRRPRAYTGIPSSAPRRALPCRRKSRCSATFTSRPTNRRKPSCSNGTTASVGGIACFGVKTVLGRAKRPLRSGTPWDRCPRQASGCGWKSRPATWG